MLEWSDLSVILAVARTGTLSGAARNLGINHSTVFRRVNAIEERVGVRFFERLPSGYRLTEAGEAAVGCAERVETEVHALGREILGQDARLQGRVRVTTMEGLAALVLPGPLAAFSRMHPGLSIDLVGTVSSLDLSRREAEVAVRATRSPPESSYGRKICDFSFGLYTSPEYLESHADVPLAERDWCLIGGFDTWLAPMVWGKRRDKEQRIVFTASSIISVARATASGAGMSALPTYVGDADPGLVRVGELLHHLKLQLWLLTHPDLRKTARVKALMDFLYGFLGDRRALFEGTQGSPPPDPNQD